MSAIEARGEFTEEEMRSIRYDLVASNVVDQQMEIINEHNGLEVQRRMLDFQGL